jgi:pimeloyl-ACP methyl ester carboxylesterase
LQGKITKNDIHIRKWMSEILQEESMKHSIHFFTISLILLLTGCAGTQVPFRHDIAESFDAERIAYVAAGQGKTALIWIHGWSCDGRYWQKQMSEFATTYEVIAIDLAGHGHSSLERSDYSMLSFAKDVQAVIEQEHLERVILIGHSMGGGVIAQAARLTPKQVVGLIAIDTLQNVGERVDPAVMEEMIKPFDSDFKRATQDFVTPMFLEGADPQLVHWVRQDMSSAPRHVALSALRNYLGQFVTGEAASVFGEINIPVVSINARIWPSSPEENRKHINNYQLFYIEGTGHFPMLEKPEALNRLIKKAIDAIEANGKEK